MGNRDLSATWAYHDGTKHSPESIRRSPGFLDWDNLPLPFKIYKDLEPIPLPHDTAATSRPALAAIADAGSAAGGGPALDLRVLAHVLHCSAGVLRRRTHPGGEVFFRAQACTGNLHHIDLYLVCGALAGLAAGIYHFGPHDFALRRLRSGDYRAAVVEATGREPAIAGAPVVVACTSTFWRNAWKYRSRTYRHCFWDNGTLLANLLAVSAALDVPARVVLGFVDDTLDRLLELDSRREVTLSLVALGSGAAPPPSPPPVSPIELETLPLSVREIDYPAVREAHVASSLRTVEEVVSWRRPLLAAPSAPAPERCLPLAPRRSEPSETIERVIRRRGSTRRFSHAPINFAALSTILRSVSRGVPADYVAPADVVAELYLIVNAVDGLAPGTYFFDRLRDGFVPLRAGDLRREAGHLALGQALAADAAVNLYWLVDLGPVLERLGNRGYRAAQLDAAIAGGKSYLAAFALGLGATGLTFFDDDVTAFFSPHAEGKSVMFLMAVGKPEGRGPTR